jgi:hypothetical protein
MRKRQPAEQPEVDDGLRSKQFSRIAAWTAPEQARPKRQAVAEAPAERDEASDAA